MSKTQLEKLEYSTFHQDNQFCWACQMQPLPYELTEGLAGKLEAAHIVGGAGRVHSRKSLVMLCKIHHMVQEGETIRVAGRALPKITLANMLWLKRRFDLSDYDQEFIRECRRLKNGRIDLPEPAPLGPISEASQ